MSASIRINAPVSLILVKIISLAGGILYVLTGISLLFAPRWFFENVGLFPPFNRHYMGDLGSFLVPLGVGLVLASRDPLRHRSLVAVAAAGSLLHALNHVGDAIAGGHTLEHWLVDAVPLLVFALLLLLVFRLVESKG